jgi:hypothetical protein
MTLCIPWLGTAVPAQRDEAAEDARPVTVWVGAIVLTKMTVKHV